jgi:hypothetical protein
MRRGPRFSRVSAVLAGTVALEHFEAVAGRHPQVIQSTGDFNLSQLAPPLQRCSQIA